MKTDATTAILARSLLPEEEKALATSAVKQIILLKSDFFPKDEALQRLSVVYQDNSDYSEAHLQRIINFAHLPLIDGKTIVDFFSSEKSSDWYYLRFSLFQRSRNQMILADELNAAIKAKADPAANLLIYLNTSLPKELIEGNAEVISQLNQKKSKHSISVGFIIKYLLLFFFRSIGGAFLKVIRRPAAKKLIIANPYLEQEVFDLKTAERKIGDPHLQNLIDLSLDKGDCIYLTQLRPPSLEANHKLSMGSYLREQPYDAKSLYFEPYLFATLFSRRFYRAIGEIKKKFKALNKLQSDNSIEGSKRFLLKRFMSLKNTLILAKWREIAAERMWKALDLEKILAIDEHSLQNSTLFMAARKCGIKTYALQHGAISRANIAYRFVQEDENYRPWPRLTFIRGEHNRSQLIANHYPEESLEVVGHLRTDIIPLLKEKSQEESGIVYATQPMPPADAGLKERQLSDFLKLCQQLPNERFIIKPHPNEADIDRYRKLANNEDHPNLEVYEGNLYQLLASCKFLITYYSTVGLEAIYFDKEVLCLDYEKRDYQAYHAAGVAHRALNEKELIEMSRDILQGKLKTSEGQKSEFIKARAFKIDGKASERVLEAFN